MVIAQQQSALAREEEARREQAEELARAEENRRQQAECNGR